MNEVFFNINELKQLGLKHGTDKASAHSYTEIYSNLFKHLRNNKIRLLEIGAGDLGASHKMWRDYFPNAEIFCIDTFPLLDHQKDVQTILEDYGVKVFKGNQLNKDDLKNFIKCFGENFDVIIDDGAHLPDAIQTSLGFLFPFLKSGGLYIVEDLVTAKDRQQRLDAVNKHIEGLLSIPHVVDYNLEESFRIYEDTKVWNSSMLDDKEKEYLANNISTWIFYNDTMGPKNLCVIKKK